MHSIQHSAIVRYTLVFAYTISTYQAKVIKQYNILKYNILILLKWDQETMDDGVWFNSVQSFLRPHHLPTSINKGGAVYS